MKILFTLQWRVSLKEVLFDRLSPLRAKNSAIRGLAINSKSSIVFPNTTKSSAYLVVRNSFPIYSYRPLSAKFARVGEIGLP